jgi:hypothetical protein
MSTETAAPAGGLFKTLPTQVALHGGAAYIADTQSESAQGLFRFDTPGAAAVAIVQTGDPLPGHTDTFGAVYSFCVAPHGVVFEAAVMRNTGFLYEGVFHAATGVVNQIMGLGTPIPDGSTSTFASTQPTRPALSSGEIQFRSGTRGKNGVYILPAPGHPGAGRVVADTATQVPDAQSNFTFPAYSWAGDFDEGNSVFHASNAGNANIGVYARLNGTLLKIVDKNTPLPGGAGFFTFPGGNNPVEMAIAGQRIVFLGFHSIAQSGIYLWDQGTVSKIVAPGDTLGDRTVYSAYLQRDGFTGNRLAFLVQDPQAGFSLWLAEWGSDTPAPPSLTISHSAGHLILEWNAPDATLQYSDTLDPQSWHELTEAVSPHTLEPPLALARFYRLYVAP